MMEIWDDATSQISGQNMTVWKFIMKLIDIVVFSSRESLHWNMFLHIKTCQWCFHLCQAGTSCSLFWINLSYTKTYV